MEEQVEMTKEQLKSSYRLMNEDPEGKDRPCVFIEKGPFAGITVAYGKFQMADEENDDGSTKCRFEYDMIGIPPDMMEKEFSDEEGEKFEKMLGEVFIDILDQELERRKEESEDGKTRRYDFTKPVI